MTLPKLGRWGMVWLECQVRLTEARLPEPARLAGQDMDRRP